MGLEATCKEETSRMKNISIESSGGKTIFGVEENFVFTEKSFIYIYIYHPMILQCIVWILRASLI
jgi:hypothetical protein